jgi:hypothetical protein
LNEDFNKFFYDFYISDSNPFDTIKSNGIEIVRFCPKLGHNILGGGVKIWGLRKLSFELII